MLEIRRGTKEDIAQVAAIYDHILTEEEEGRAVIGWIRGVYPTENTAKEAVKNDDLFVMTDAGRIVAAAIRSVKSCGRFESLKNSAIKAALSFS